MTVAAASPAGGPWAAGGPGSAPPADSVVTEYVGSSPSPSHSAASLSLRLSAGPDGRRAPRPGRRRARDHIFKYE